MTETAKTKKKTWLTASPIPLLAFCLIFVFTSSHHLPALQTPRPSVLLITIDTWRWDYLGIAGTGKVQTPNIDNLARHGFYIPKIQSPCPLTTPAHASILTGLTPYHHGIRDNLHYRLKSEVPTLATILASHGYQTAAVISGAPLHSFYGLAKGFQLYIEKDFERKKYPSFIPASRRAQDTVILTQEFLYNASPNKPIFLWVHFYDPHHPYDPPEPFRQMYAKDPYAGEVAYVDNNIGVLIKSIKSQNWVIIITGDHGESLGEHDEPTHGMTLYESAIEVPLIIFQKLAKLSSRSQPSALIDVTPTVCSLLHINCPKFDGQSLLSPSKNPRWISSETVVPTTSFSLNPVLALRKGTTLWIHHGVDEVYDLKRDPDQQNDLSKTNNGRAFIKDAIKQIPKLFGLDPLESISNFTQSLSPEQREALSSLGYTGVASFNSKDVMPMNIRHFLSDANILNQAREAFMNKDYTAADKLYRVFLEKYPRSALALKELGYVLISQSRYAEAFTLMKEARNLDRGDPDILVNLGNLYLLQDRVQEAVRLYRQSLLLQPSIPEAHLNLAHIYLFRLHKPQEALPHLEKFLELEPSDPEAPKLQELILKIKQEHQNSHK